MRKLKKLKEILTYILALLLAVELCVLLELHKQSEAELQSMAKQHVELQTDLTEMQSKNSTHGLQIDTLTNQVRELQDKAARSGEREPKLTSLGEYTVTAYCACEKCCGEYAKNRPDGKVYGAAGIELTSGVSVAGWLPMGSQIVIDGHEYTVQDRTAKWIKDKYDSRIIDIYMTDHQAALDWGKQIMEVFEVN